MVRSRIVRAGSRAARRASDVAHGFRASDATYHYYYYYYYYYCCYYYYCYYYY